MRKFTSLLMLGLVGAGLWYFFQHFSVEGLEGITIHRKDAAVAEEDGSGGPSQAAPPVERDGSTIRIASYNIQVFGESKLAKPEVMEVLAEVVRRFDVVAVQEVRAKSQDVLPQFVERINSTGRKYDYLIGPRLGRTSSKEQYAFIYDTQSVEPDRGAVYTVADPQDLLHRAPLVAPFRVRGPPPDQAFTFTLVNIHTDPDETDTELNALDDVFQAVRADGRGEDDVILLGDLNVDENHLGQLGQMPYAGWVVSGVTTNTRGNKQYDNIVYHRLATVELTGKWGVFDVTHEFHLTPEQALDVSDHLPVWAELSIYEGGTPGRVAAKPGPAGATQ